MRIDTERWLINRERKEMNLLGDLNQRCKQLRADGWRPNQMKVLNEKEVELISFPFPRGNHVMIMARLTKGDPTSMRSFIVPEGE